MYAIQDWGPSKFGAQIAIVPRKIRHAPGEPVLLTVYLRRRGGVEIVRVQNLGEWLNYEWSVVSSDGVAAPRSQFGRRIAEREFAERIELQLAPGQVIITTIPLNALFDLTAPAAYEVSATRTIWVGAAVSPDTLASNRIEILVDEDEASVLAGEAFL